MIRMHKSSGFTLVELAIVVLVFGLITGAFFTYLAASNDQGAYQLTVDRQKKIAIALHDYVSSHNYLPCPAEELPTGGRALGEMLPTCTTIGELVGIVPFRSLGLSQQDATDGYGNPFTYAVTRQATAATDQVHQDCRRTGIWVSGTNYDPDKARFCCQRALNSSGTVMQVRNASAGTAVVQVQGAALADTNASPDVAAAATTGTNLAYFAYVLVSHGKDGWGSFIMNSATKRTSSGSADQGENSDDDNIFVDRRASSATASVFDDIVLWRTQEQVIAETGTDTCARP